MYQANVCKVTVLKYICKGTASTQCHPEVEKNERERCKSCVEIQTGFCCQLVKLFSLPSLSQSTEADTFKTVIVSRYK